MGQSLKRELHLEALPPAQVRVLKNLGPFSTELGYYLAGGTAVALRLGHRESVDLDWFGEGPLPEQSALTTHVRDSGTEIEVRAPEATGLHVTIVGVQVSWIKYKYQVLDPPEWIESLGCHMAGMSDLSAMKLSALTQRGLRRDFVDIYAIGRSGIRLRTMIDNYKRHSGIATEFHVLKALTYFEDAEKHPMPQMLTPVSWDAIKETIVGWTKSLAR